MISPEHDPSGKVLWLCRENIGRSQVAQALWNIEDEGSSLSAGFNVDKPGNTLLDQPEAQNLISIMNEEFNIDIAHRRRTSVAAYSEELLKKARLIVVLCEPEVIPLRFFGFKNVEMWEIQDMKGESRIETSRIVGEIRNGLPKIRSLLS